MIRHEDGFTAVELLITLFIAAIFLFAGYQLYTQVSRDGNETDRSARVSNLVYRILKENAATIPDSFTEGCNPSAFPAVGSNFPATATPFETRASEKAGNVNVEVAIYVRCPFASTTSGNYLNMFQIVVTGKYSESGTERMVRHATYANSQ